MYEYVLNPVRLKEEIQHPNHEEALPNSILYAHSQQLLPCSTAATCFKSETTQPKPRIITNWKSCSRKSAGCILITNKDTERETFNGYISIPSLFHTVKYSASLAAGVDGFTHDNMLFVENRKFIYHVRKFQEPHHYHLPFPWPSILKPTTNRQATKERQAISKVFRWCIEY